MLNSGTVVLTPSLDTLEALVRFLESDPRVKDFLFPDQDVLATVFEGRWKPLPYVYNALKTLRVIHPGLWKDDDVKNVHFILTGKPWSHTPKEGELPEPESSYAVLDRWWWKEYEGLRRESSESEEHKRAFEIVETYVGK